SRCYPGLGSPAPMVPAFPERNVSLYRARSLHRSPGTLILESLTAPLNGPASDCCFAGYAEMDNTPELLWDVRVPTCDCSGSFASNVEVCAFPIVRYEASKSLPWYASGVVVPVDLAS